MIAHFIGKGAYEFYVQEECLVKIDNHHDRNAKECDISHGNAE
jgi:hypothetical protein